MNMQSYTRELSEGIQPLIFAVDGTDRSVDGAVNSSSFDSLFQYMTLAQNNKSSITEEPLVLSSSTPMALEPKGNQSSFFSRARVVTVSKSHAFPPSSDPVGNFNRTSKISSVLGLRATQTSLSRGPPSPSKVQYSTASVSDNAIISYLRRNPIEGILSEGWIEKHIHALPSVVLVVVHLDFLSWNNKLSTTTNTTGISSSSTSKPYHAGAAAAAATTTQPAYYHQAKCEKHLSDLCDHIRSSLAEKRACSIHLVCIIPTQSVGTKIGNLYTPPTSSFMQQTSTSAAFATLENEKIQSIRNVCKLSPGSVSILHYSTSSNSVDHDINMTKLSPFPTAELLKLEIALQETSSSYYRHQIKRLKDKLHYLHLQTHPELLTAASRYCFKIAVFLEVEERTHGASTGGGRNVPTNTHSMSTSGGGGYSNFMTSPLLFPKVIGRGKDTSSSSIGGESLKYLYDAYDFVATYYHYLMNGTASVMESNVPLLDEEEEEEDNYKQRELTTSTLDSKNGDSNLVVDTQPALVTVEDSIEVSQEILDNDEMEAVLSSPTIDNTDQDVEMGEPISHPSSNLTQTVVSTNQSIHAEDMCHQCRAFAHWVNYNILFKLSSLLSTLDTTLKKPLIDNPLLDTDVKGFLNHRRVEILESLAKQVRRHCGIFLPIHHRHAQYGLAQKTVDMVDDSIDPLWNYLLYVYQQRLVLAQLTERYVHPLYVQARKEKLFTMVTGEVWDILNASSLYASVGEIVLRLDNVIRKDLSLVKKTKIITHDDNRRKFVGSLSLFALKTRFQQERQRNYLAIAIDCMRRSVALREEMNEKMKKWNDALAVKYRFLISLILMKERKYDEANAVLLMISQKSHVFSQIQLDIARALMECNQLVTSPEQSKIQDISLSLILNPSTCYLMEPSDKRLITKVVSSVDPHVNYTKAFNFVSQRERSSPISYAVSFPDKIVAVDGDEVPLVIQLRSKLTFALELREIQLSTNQGLVHTIDFQGTGRCLILSPKRIFCLRTSLKVQDMKNLIYISDGNRSAMKAPKPYTFGLSYIHSAGSVDGKLLNQILTAGAVTLRPSSLSLTVSFEIPNSRVILHYNNIESKFKVDKEMFITTSYNRHGVFPINYGPSHIFITRPKARIEVSNKTAYCTQGKVLEGTVNRIILELKPGSRESCKNMEISISCSSKLIGEEKYAARGSSSSLLDQEELVDSDDIDRSPVIVQQSASFDVSLPLGWILYGDNGRGNRDRWLPVADFIDEGSVAHTSVNLFRLLPSYIDPEYAQSSCQTDITLLIRYLQINTDRHNRDEVLVEKEFHDTVIWHPPISASFLIVTHNIKSLPTGSYFNSSTPATTFLRIGDLVPIRCSVQATQASDGLFVRLLDASFSSTFDEHEEPCKLDLIGSPISDKGNGVIFQPNQNDVNSLLKSGTNISMLYVIRPTSKESNLSKSPFFTRLGCVRINWKPIPFIIPQNIQENDTYKGLHGALPLSDISPIIFAGPRCYLEETPFTVKMKAISTSPKVLMPFDVEYQVVNKMDVPQKIQFQLESMENETNRSFIVVGGGNCELYLSPRETKPMCYSMLALRSGKVTLPKLTISSELCQSWVVHGGTETIILP